VADDRTATLERAVLVAYLVLAMAPLVIGATHDEFYPVGPVAAAMLIAIYAALVFRHRWAWTVLVVFEAFVLASFLWDFTSVVALVLVAASFGLLLSRPMRDHVSGATRA
jgi:hypothetical protein